MHPSPLQCPRLWWGSDVPVDAIHLFHIRDWVAARLHGLPGPIHSLTPQTRAGMIPVLLAHPVLAWLLRLSTFSSCDVLGEQHRRRAVQAGGN